MLHFLPLSPCTLVFDAPKAILQIEHRIAAGFLHSHPCRCRSCMAHLIPQGDEGGPFRPLRD